MINLITTILAQSDTSSDLGAQYGSPWGRTLDLADFVGIILSSGIAIGGVVVLFTFIFGGISVIRGASNNDPKSAAQGKLAVTYALLGFLIVITSYWAIRAIELMTGSAFLTSPFGGAPPPLEGTGPR